MQKAARLNRSTPHYVKGVNVNEQKADGRFMFALTGEEICFAWGRSVDGCGEECQQQVKRAHVCEWCREPHRTINCPVHKNWKPPPPKGKWKGGKRT